MNNFVLKLNLLNYGKREKEGSFGTVSRNFT